jgi:hypothetical protein
MESKFSTNINESVIKSNPAIFMKTQYVLHWIINPISLINMVNAICHEKQ